MQHTQGRSRSKRGRDRVEADGAPRCSLRPLGLGQGTGYQETERKKEETMLNDMGTASNLRNRPWSRGALCTENKK